MTAIKWIVICMRAEDTVKDISGWNHIFLTALKPFQPEKRQMTHRYADMWEGWAIRGTWLVISRWPPRHRDSSFGS